jgi:hypothetical protein
MLSRFTLQDCNPIIHPINRGTTLTQFNPKDVLKDITTYQSRIGSIMYLVTGTQTDLTFTISFLAQFSPAPNTQYIAAVKRCLQSIKGIRNLTLLFPYGGEMFITELSDNPTMVTVSTTDDLFQVICLNSDIRQFLVVSETKICVHIYYRSHIYSPFQSCKALPLVEDYLKRSLIFRNTNSPIL